ncbi:leukocyte surface antigen CD47 isoform X7 [Pipistrellus kuhlii]|uniref:leukocyte surface antigen CD47 isoform X7 n=1 Tax=Pipistrellus kuhlii TaxID=59472 RepID=UPI001E2743E6|nr:leukocyte surface antigen CD47 isoform X7 [Pipistrellus kuhlii]
MWPLLVLLLLGSASRGSAQLIFNITKFVDYTTCNQTVVIPCIVNNVEAKSLREMFVKWKFRDIYFFSYNGEKNESKPSNSNFSSAYIVPEALLSGIASLKMDKSQAVPGNYTCEVTELTREGETTIELKYRVVSWFSPNENILIVIFPMLAVLLFWGQFGIVSEYSTKRASGLGLIVVPTVILILLQYSVFMIAPAIGMSSFSITILILQVLGFVLSVVGLSLCVSECTPMHGPLLISGLGIIALAELLGLVYMKFVASNQRAIQPPRKAVEEPLNAFKESKGMMNDE